MEHPCSGDPAFLALLLNELHKVPRHNEVQGGLQAMLATSSVTMLLDRCLDRMEGDLDPRRAAQLPAFLSLLTRPSTGLTGAELLGLMRQIHQAFDQSDLSLLRERLDALIVETDGTFRITTCLVDGVRRRTSTPEMTASVDRAWLAYFSDERRRFTPRSMSLLTDLDTPAVLRELRAIASDPRGLVALRTTFGQSFPGALAIVAKANGVRAAQLVREAAAAVVSLDDDVSLAVAETCLDYRLLHETERIVATTQWEDVQDDARLSNRILAVTARAALRGGAPMSLAEWQFVLDHGMATHSSNVHLAMSGIGAMLARRGNAYWAAKYFKQALEVAFACGNPAGIAGSGSNAALAAATDGDAGLFRHMIPLLRKLFDSSVSLSASAGDTETLMASLFRRS